jgi:hypothetical protein
MLAPSDQEKIAPQRFSVSYVSVFGTGGVLIPTPRKKTKKLFPYLKFRR